MSVDLATVSFFFVPFILVLGGGWVLGAIFIPFTIRRAPIHLRLLSVVGSTLMASGAVGFFGSGLSAAGGLNWLPPSFEWPVGYANDVVTTTDGLHVVPLDAPARVQVYDAGWHFLRGWAVGMEGKAFKVQISRDRQIELFGVRKHEIYTLQGALVRREPFPDNADAYNAIPDGTSCLVPTPIWLWVFTGPFASWATAATGLLLLALTKRLAKPWNPTSPPAPSESQVPPEAVTLHKTERVTVIRKDPPDNEAEIPGKFSAGSYGCLGAILIWTLGWLNVAYLALARVRQFPNVSALVGALTSAMVVSAGCGLSLLLLMSGSPQRAVNVSNRVSMPRRIMGWVAALVWFSIAVVWNLAIFGTLFRLAKTGDGWMILLLLLWSLVGLFLLFVLLTGIGVVIDSLLRLARQDGQ